MPFYSHLITGSVLNALSTTKCTCPGPTFLQTKFAFSLYAHFGCVHPPLSHVSLHCSMQFLASFDIVWRPFLKFASLWNSLARLARTHIVWLTYLLFDIHCGGEYKLSIRLPCMIPYIYNFTVSENLKIFFSE